MVGFDEFVKFIRMQLETGDYDAHIPLLKALAKDLELSRSEAIWLGLIYMAFYSEGSMWAHRSNIANGREVEYLHELPVTKQRRNLHGGRIVEHLNEIDRIENLSNWIDKAKNWDELLALVGEINGNGRWASYTTSELLTHLAELDYQPTSIEILDSSGPKGGLIALALEPTEASAMYVIEELEKRENIIQPLSVIESLLCDWGGINKGTFYSGRNIDRQQGRILDVQKLGYNCDKLWEIRKKVYPHYTLGELNGWEGIDKFRLRYYKEHGLLLKSNERR